MRSSFLWGFAMLSALGLPLAAQLDCSTQWTLTEAVRIGSVDGEDALSGVNDLTISPTWNRGYVAASRAQLPPQ